MYKKQKYSFVEGSLVIQIKLRGNQTVKQVDEFAYLGSIISNDRRNNSEIIKRICQAKIAFNSKKTLLASRNVSLKIKKNLLKTYVWSIALYGCEIWTITTENRRRLESFEMWCYRRMLRINWMDRITNKEVLDRITEAKLIWKNIVRRRNEWIGHIMRHEGLLKLIIEGCIDGKNRRGRPRLEYIQQIIKDLQGCNSYVEMKRKTDNREEWKMAANQSAD
uniref:Endonuclease-reverse transcriptase n=1 Tax=Schizaphis graminum TaxID=13262 RepID=A0A2S2PJ80_SCHGA